MSENPRDMMTLANDIGAISDGFSSENETLPTLQQKIKDLDLLIQTSYIYQKQKGYWTLEDIRKEAKEFLAEEPQNEEVQELIKAYSAHLNKLTDAERELEAYWTNAEKEIRRLGGVNLGTVHKANAPLVKGILVNTIGPVILAIKGALGLVENIIRLAINILSIPFYKNEDLRLQLAIAGIAISMKMIVSAIITPFYRIATVLIPAAEPPSFKDQIHKIANPGMDDGADSDHEADSDDEPDNRNIKSRR